MDSPISRARSALLRFVFGAGAQDWSGALRAAFALAAFGIAFAVNALARNPTSGFSVLLYLPAIFIVTFLTGWAWGLLALVASFAIAWWFVSDPLFSALGVNSGPGLAIFSLSAALLYGVAVLARAAVHDAWRTEMKVLREVHERKLADEQRDLVIGELRHRMKNLITVIDALAKNSRRRGEKTPGVDEFLKRFLGRLHALAAAADLLLAGDREAIDAHAVIRATLFPFDEEKSNRIRIGGPDLQLSEDLGGGLALAVHELATNALKFGALSVPGGTISLTWTVTPGAQGDEVVFEWKEQGGPTPEPPTREGFGNRVIKSVTSREKTGSVTIEYPPEGVTCRIAYVKPRATN